MRPLSSYVAWLIGSFHKKELPKAVETAKSLYESYRHGVVNFTPAPASTTAA
jgi:hypothetical protein